jgi:Raf kinase inhibitor-like YbhB/YbcL family protein
MSVLSFVGKLTRKLRAGEDRLLYHRAEFAGVPISIQVSSSAFNNDAPMPVEYTVSGEDMSPPLAWANLPAGTRDLALVVEDYDISLPSPMVHLIAYHLDAASGGWPADFLPSKNSVGQPSTIEFGRNGLGFCRYDGPAPPPGHSTHHYVFQLFALGRRLDFSSPPLRNDLVAAMKDRVLAMGLLTGTFERT